MSLDPMKGFSSHALLSHGLLPINLKNVYETKGDDFKTADTNTASVRPSLFGMLVNNLSSSPATRNEGVQSTSRINRIRMSTCYQGTKSYMADVCQPF